MEIQYTLVTSSLGRLLVGRTDRGICAVYPGDSDTALEEQLAAEFPRAERRKVASPFTEARLVRTALDKGAREFPALDVGGTAFLGQGRGAGMRDQQCGGPGTVPPGYPRRRRHGWIPVGYEAEGSPPESRRRRERGLSGDLIDALPGSPYATCRRTPCSHCCLPRR